MSSKNVDVINFQVGLGITGTYMISNMSVRTASNGSGYLSATISDKTGAIPCVMWDYNVATKPFNNGDLVTIVADVREYKGNKQLTLSSLLRANTEEVDKSRFVDEAKVDVESYMDYINQIIDTIIDDDYKAVAKNFFLRYEDTYKNLPAARGVHHAFIHGLLLHTSEMLMLADFISSRRTDIINRDLLLTGVIIHDVAKRDEYELNDLGLATDYTKNGNLIGHLVMGYSDVVNVCKELNIPSDKTDLLCHMILSHHGNPEWGAAVKPMTAEAITLHLVDYIDSRLEILSELIPTVEIGNFSDPVKTLDGVKIFRHF